MGKPRVVPARTNLAQIKIEGKSPIKDSKLLRDGRHLLYQTADSAFRLIDLIKVRAICYRCR